MERMLKAPTWAPGWAVLTLLLFVSTNQVDAQSIARASSTPPGVRYSWDRGTESWCWFTPTGKDVIRWSSGDNQADGLLYPLLNYGPETKFDTTVSPPASIGAYLGFSRDDGGPLPLNSIAETDGTGYSSVIIRLSCLGRFYEAFWEVVATGTLGTRSNASFRSVARGRDPYSITPSSLAEIGISGPAYDLYFGAGLESGTFTGAGSISLNAYYDVFGSTRNILTIRIDAGNVEVSTDLPQGSRIYRVDSLDDVPSEDPNMLMTAASIRAYLLSDVSTDMTIDFPLILGVDLEDLPVPTVDMGDGSIARIRVESEVRDGAGGAPTAVANLAIEGGMLSWSPDPAAGVYDVVLGDLGALRSTRSFTASLLGCLKNNTADVHTPDIALLPHPGNAFYYLTRSVTPLGVTGTYSSAAVDAEIAAAPAACP